MISTVKFTTLHLIVLLAIPALSRAADPSSKKVLPLMVPHGKFSQDCGQCHVAKRWDVIRNDFHFDHAKETGYPLNGAHAQAKCVQCHNDRGPVNVYSARGCAGCHPDPHRATLGMDCNRCHTEFTWRPKNSIAEHARTAFPLSGAHLAQDCQACHVRASVGEYKGAPLLCTNCHQKDYIRGPNHVRFNYPRTCNDCHTTSSFSGARFNHSFLSNVADCYTCHQVDFQRAANHVSFNYPRTCGDCHTTSSFSGARFTHSFMSQTVACNSCHAADFQRAPCHVPLNYSTLCYNCHSTNTWQNGQPVPTCP